MTVRRHLLKLAAVAALAAAFAPPATAQGSIKIGEINSYKTLPAFLEPYRKGWELAVEETNAAGGVFGRKLEVISRDDNGNPGDAVRLAEELISRENVHFLTGTFLSNIGLAVADFAKQKKVLFLAAEPLTDKIVWDNGNKYTFRLRPSTYMQTAMLVPDAAKLRKKRWAIVYPNYEYGQSATPGLQGAPEEGPARRGVRAEQAVPLGKIDAGAVVQALADAKPDAIFSSLFGPDLARFVREGEHARPVQGSPGVQPARRRARVPRSAEGRGAGRLVRHRLPVVRDRHAGAQEVPRRLPEAAQRLSAPRLGRRLHDGHDRGRRR